ncbi:hypothetical protein SteCoe_26129 [Stentor coeruleus]|uniref:Uncharacterized protein n=1 Tax=Stentor coeruleus TaxID=5963 RepID=A0A1R2BDP6_9CILI|nr:hypothetical protein SteCoe_26129 [Stentor coeruleus]
MDPETLAKTIATRDLQIDQLAEQLKDSLVKVDSLCKSYESAQKENFELKKKLEKKTQMIKQEENDISLLKGKINSYSTRTWSDTFSGFKSWISSKMPTRIVKDN